MSPSTFVIVVALGVLVMSWYANTSKRNKILCTFRRVNKTKLKKFVTMNKEFVIFDGKKYDIIPSCITFEWYTGGFIHMLFPQWVATLDYTWGKRLPLNPNRMDYDWDNPENRKAINISDIIKSYFSTANPVAVKKQSMLKEYAPWIAILLVVLVGFWLYNNMSGLATDISILNNKINAITQ